MNCITIITGFPVMKAARSQLDWLTFSCSCAKSYITEEPAQHVEVSTWLSCQKLQGKKKTVFPLLHRLGQSHGGIPVRAKVTQANTEQAEETSAFGIPSSSPTEAVCACRKAASARVSIRAIYPGSRLPGYQRAHSCNMLTCPSNLQHVSFIFAFGEAARLHQLFQA